VIVASNCQTAGLTAALRILLPEQQVEAFPYSEAAGDGWDRFVGKATVSDVLVTSAPEAWIDAVRREPALDGLQIVTVPEVVFSAFHPDLVYAWLPGPRTLEGVVGPYHSAIALWAFRRGLDCAATAALYTPAVFESLGYLSEWPGAVERLLARVSAHPGLDGKDFLLRLQHRGVFMHSVNHPRTEAIAQLARQIAMMLGGRARVLDEPVEDFLIDTLKAASFVWPVYPGVADELGLPGSLTWKLAHHRVIRLEEFLRLSFEAYAAAGNQTWTCQALELRQYDAVLQAAIAGHVR
jgi:hypothetical protein